MQEKTKLICLILFNTTVILITYFFDFIDESPEEAVGQDLVAFGISAVGFIAFGLMTENFKRLLIYSFVSALIYIIFFSTEMYYSPDDHNKIPPDFGNSIALFGFFCFSYMSILAFSFIGTGMILSNLFRKIFRR